MEEWPDCPVDGCPYKICRVLNSNYCFQHTPGNKYVKHMKIDAMHLRQVNRKVKSFLSFNQSLKDIAEP